MFTSAELGIMISSERLLILSWSAKNTPVTLVCLHLLLLDTAACKVVCADTVAVRLHSLANADCCSAQVSEFCLHLVFDLDT